MLLGTGSSKMFIIVLLFDLFVLLVSTLADSVWFGFFYPGFANLDTDCWNGFFVYTIISGFFSSYFFE